MPFGECPNESSCGHVWHDVYELGDPYPTCCDEGCRCGHAGDAVLRRDADGTVTVERADPVIRVSRELLEQAPEAWDGDVLTLDTAGVYRYTYLRPDPEEPSRALIFGRVKA